MGVFRVPIEARWRTPEGRGGFAGQAFTMDLSDVLHPSRVVLGVKAEDKKHLLAELSEVASDATGLRAREIYHTLMQRERLGSTGLGRGIAIPHARMPMLRSIVCVFARLDRPMPFDSLDGEPVDLVAMLLSPDHAGADHLKVLAKLSRSLRDPLTLESLRTTRDRATVHAILTAPDVQLSKAG